MHVVGQSAGRFISRRRFRPPISGSSDSGRRLGPDRRGEIEQAIAEERRRLARELHDSVAQDLAFILSQSLRLANGAVDEPALERIAAAAERALSDARAAIYRLSSPLITTLGAAVCEQANRIAQQEGLTLRLEVADDVETTPEIEHALLRIVREAVSNAARHAGASIVFVKLFSREGKLVITVADDGCGFDPTGIETTVTSGFGLISMRERAHSVGGEVQLQSQLGAGTVVEVAVPA